MTKVYYMNAEIALSNKETSAVRAGQKFFYKYCQSITMPIYGKQREKKKLQIVAKMHNILYGFPTRYQI